VSGELAGVVTGDAELAARMAGVQLRRGSLEEAERYVVLAGQGLESVPPGRRGRAQVVLAVVRMRLARQRGDLPVVAERARPLLAAAGDADPARFGLGEDLRALALIELGIAEVWTARFDEADRDLEEGVALARRIGRPFLEIAGLAHWAQLASWRSFPAGEQRGRQAIELAGRHGWTEEPVAGVAHLALGFALVAQGRLEEGERSLEQAERTLRAEVEPAAGMRLRYARGLLDLVSGRPETALSAFQAAERLARLLVTEHALARRLRAHTLQTLVRLGRIQHAEQTLAAMDGPERDSGPMRNAIAVLRLAQDDPKAATAALAPVIDGSVPLLHASLWMVQAWLLEAIARDALADAAAARRALERALDLAKPEDLLFPFLLDAAPGLLDRHRRLGTAHAVFISEILNVLSGSEAHSGLPPRLIEPLSQSEVRVLRYLPTQMSAPEIADQLYLSVNTVKTHMRHVYDKLGAHRRHEAVEQARALGLLAPTPRRP
jgi:LuxR family transcriptional regulator, maltose regulon positive regulatory protein